jgi:S1-C subfamily serine protease
MRILKSLRSGLNNYRNQGVLTALGLALLVLLFMTLQQQPSISTQSARIVRNSSTTASSLIASPEGAQSAVTTSTEQTTNAATSTPNTATKKTSSDAIAKSPIALPPSPAVLSARQLNSSGALMLKSLVNIVCVSNDPAIPSISGSGVIIDSRGIILTAAHVAQLFLLQDYLGTNKVQCLIRAGSPARRAYLAEPIYVSPLWIQQNPTTLTATSPSGTGENDFALLAITASATSTPLASSFPALPLVQGDPGDREPVAIGSYGAQYLSPDELNYSLYPILVFGDIQTRYTFDTKTVDLVSVEGSAASQEGSSGGGIVNASGELVGTITTSSIAGSIGTRSLNAVTINHMRRSFRGDTGQNFDSYLRNNSLSVLVAGFARQSQQLGQLLAQTL